MWRMVSWNRFYNQPSVVCTEIRVMRKSIRQTNCSEIWALQKVEWEVPIPVPKGNTRQYWLIGFWFFRDTSWSIIKISCIHVNNSCDTQENNLHKEQVLSWIRATELDPLGMTSAGVPKESIILSENLSWLEITQNYMLFVYLYYNLVCIYLQ